MKLDSTDYPRCICSCCRLFVCSTFYGHSTPFAIVRSFCRSKLSQCISCFAAMSSLVPRPSSDIRFNACQQVKYVNLCKLVRVCRMGAGVRSAAGWAMGKTKWSNNAAKQHWNAMRRRRSAVVTSSVATAMATTAMRHFSPWNSVWDVFLSVWAKLSLCVCVG